MRKIFLLFILCCTHFILLAQPKDPVKGMTQAEIDAYLKKMGVPAMQQKARTNAGKAAAVQNQQEPKLVVGDTKRTKAYYNLSKPFRENVLPNGLAVNTQQSIEQQAGNIASIIFEGKDNAGAAIVTAFRASGFFIKKTNGSTLAPMQGNMGIIISEKEILIACKIIAEGYGVGLKLYLNSLLKRNLNIVETDDTMAVRIAYCMKNGKHHQDKGVRFFSCLLDKTQQLENQDESLGLLNLETNGYKQERLNALSFLLMSYRLMMDMYVTGQNGTTNSTSLQTLSTEGFAAAHGPNIGTYLSKTNNEYGSAADDNCTSDIPGYAQDAGAAVKTFFFGKIWGFGAERLGSASEASFDKFSSGAGSVLTVLKFIANYSLLNIKITGNNYIKRSRNKEDGDKEPYTVNVSIDKSKLLQGFNCFRETLNKLGMDFNVNNEGAVSGVKVSWKLVVKGGYTEVNDELAKDFGSNLLRSAKELFNTIQGDKVATQNCITPFAKIESTNYASCISLTDENGNADIELVGKGLPIVLKPNENKPLFRAVGIIGYVQLKATDNLDFDNTEGTIGDILGGLLPAAGGDAVGAGTGAATEYGYRMTWFPSNPYIITLRDWDYCKNGYAVGDKDLTCLVPRNNADQSYIPDFAKNLLEKHGLANMEIQMQSIAVYDAGHLAITTSGVDENYESIRYAVAIKLNSGKVGTYRWMTPNDKNVVLNEEKKAYFKRKMEWVVVSIQKLLYMGPGQADFIESYIVADAEIKSEDRGAGENVEIGNYTGTEGTVFIEKNDGKTVAGYYQGHLIKVTKSGGKSIVPIYGRFEANIIKK